MKSDSPDRATRHALRLTDQFKIHAPPPIPHHLYRIIACYILEFSAWSSDGRMMLQMLGVFAEFERQMIRERTKLGLARARLEGRIGGNRASLTLKQSNSGYSGDPPAEESTISPTLFRNARFRPH